MNTTFGPYLEMATTTSKSPQGSSSYKAYQKLGPVRVERLSHIPIPPNASNDAKPSIIKEVCDNAMADGYRDCIWLCYNRGGNYFARDIAIPLESGDLEVCSLRYMSGWWKRISLRSPMKLHIVNVCKTFTVGSFWAKFYYRYTF